MAAQLMSMKGFLWVRGAAVDKAGQHLLAGPGLPFDEHRNGTVPLDDPGLLHDLEHGFGHAAHAPVLGGALPVGEHGVLPAVSLSIFRILRPLVRGEDAHNA